jgi:hypothetical protein
MERVEHCPLGLRLLMKPNISTIYMRRLSHRIAWLVIGVFICAAVVFVWKRFTPSPHLSAGTVREASAIDSKPRIQDVLGGKRPVETVRIRELLSTDDIYLRLGSSALEWSIADPEKKSGYIYFNSTDVKRGAWEFALCPRGQLNQVLPEDTRREFYGKDHHNGTNAFGEQWRKNSILVYCGELLFARQVKEPKTVYALKLKKQEGSRIQVEYLEMNLTDHP